MSACCQSPRAALSPAYTVLDQIDLAVGRGDFQAKARKLTVPKEDVAFAGLCFVNISFGDFAGSHSANPACRSLAGDSRAPDGFKGCAANFAIASRHVESGNFTLQFDGLRSWFNAGFD